MLRVHKSAMLMKPILKLHTGMFLYLNGMSLVFLCDYSLSQTASLLNVVFAGSTW